MKSFTRHLAAAAAVGAVAVPAAAQYYPPQTYPPQQTYPGYPPQTYPGYGQPGYGYGQPGYGAQNPIGAIIDSLLGNRYNVTDRRAISLCASAAVNQAQSQYRGYNNGYAGQPYGGQGFAAPAMRVTAITDVQRRSSGLRVKGMLSTGYSGYGGQYAYQNQGYARGDLTFRCNVDYRGAVTDVRIGNNGNNRRY